MCVFHNAFFSNQMVVDTIYILFWKSLHVAIVLTIMMLTDVD